jgi:DNA-directed RNA polymerase specialized sigma24 family protein
VGSDEGSAGACTPAALVERAGSGCEEAWQELVERHLPLVAAACAAHGLTAAAAAEVNQVVWLRLAERLPFIREPEALGDWIAARTRSLCLDGRWAGRRRGDVSARLGPGAPAGAPHDPEAAFARVGARCQRVLRLTGLTPAPPDGEVGAALDIAVDEVRRSCDRCLHRLGRLTGRSPEGVRGDLRAALARTPDLPGEWRAAARVAFAWVLLEVPIAERVFRSTGRAGEGTVHQARYDVGGDGVELTLEVKRDDVVLSGQVCSGTPVKLVVRWPGGERVEGTDGAGAFRVYDLPHAPLCVQLEGPVRLKTGWMVP